MIQHIPKQLMAFLPGHTIFTQLYQVLRLEEFRKNPVPKNNNSCHSSTNSISERTGQQPEYGED
jgi:hypothetical protein